MSDTQTIEVWCERKQGYHEVELELWMDGDTIRAEVIG